jgi:hypothetical protein
MEFTYLLFDYLMLSMAGMGGGQGREGYQPGPGLGLDRHSR